MSADKEIVGLINATQEHIAELMEEERIAKNGKDEIDLKAEYVEIDDEKVVFEEKELIPDQLKMYVPSYFEKMPEDLAKIKYPYESRPEYIYSNQDHSMSLTFKPFNAEVSEDDLLEIKKSFKNTIKLANKTSEFLEEGLIEAEFLKIPYFEVKTSAIDSEIYNIMFFLAVKEKFVMGTFNCLISDKDDWEDAAKAMIKTIL